MLLGGVFKATGNASPSPSLPKARGWDAISRAGPSATARPSASIRIFPINTLRLMRGAIAAQARGELVAYADAVFDAIWQEQRNMGDPAEVAAALTSAGLDAAAYAAAGEDDASEGQARRQH